MESLLPLISWGFDVVIVALLMLVARYDWRFYEIPNRYSVMIAVTALIRASLSGLDYLINALMGAALAYALLDLTRRIISKRLQQEALGFGDVKLMIGGGLWVGLTGLSPALFVASLAGLLHFAFLAILEKKPFARQKIPFGPYLVLGLLITRVAIEIDPDLFLTPFENSKW